MRGVKNIKRILENKINNSKQVFITFHKCVDIDAIASAIGMCNIVRKLGKEPFIILNDSYQNIEKGAKKILDNEIKNFNFISLDIYKELKDQDDLLIIVDANKTKQVCCEELLSSFKDIIIIDHHKEEIDTISTRYKFIKDVSSASEIVTELLRLFKIKPNDNLSNYLLAGIYLDTNKYSVNCSFRTMELVSKLLKNGADTLKVNELFEEDFFSDRKIQELVSKATFITESIALCIADENVKYTKAELAKVADYLLKYKIDAVFAAGFIDDEIISISARSKGKIDVSEVMKSLGGGGHIYSAATEVKNVSFDEISKSLNKSLNKILNKKSDE